MKPPPASPPKSGCSARDEGCDGRLMNAISASELGSAGAALMSVFHQLFAGNSGSGTGIVPPREADKASRAAIRSAAANSMRRSMSKYRLTVPGLGREAPHGPGSGAGNGKRSDAGEMLVKELPDGLDRPRARDIRGRLGAEGNDRFPVAEGERDLGRRSERAGKGDDRRGRENIDVVPRQIVLAALSAVRQVGEDRQLHKGVRVALFRDRALALVAAGNDSDADAARARRTRESAADGCHHSPPPARQQVHAERSEQRTDFARQVVMFVGSGTDDRNGPARGRRGHRTPSRRSSSSSCSGERKRMVRKPRAEAAMMFGWWSSMKRQSKARHPIVRRVRSKISRSGFSNPISPETMISSKSPNIS